MARNYDPMVYKRALPASDFLQLKRYTQTRLHADRLLLGHNRYATMGAKDDNNAHPFTHNDITLAHNGTLTGKADIVPEKDVNFATDSENVCYALSRYDEVGTIEELDGAYALTWWDASTRTINFARNKERPLWLARIGTAIAWASELEMLELAAAHVKVEIAKSWELPVGEWHSYPADALSKDPVVEKFEPKKPKPVKYRGNGRNSYSQGGYSTGTTNAGTKVQGWMNVLTDNGYIRGFTTTGEQFSFNVPKAEIERFKAAYKNNLRVEGTVSSWHSSWNQGTGGYVKMNNLSAPTVKILHLTSVGSKEEDKKKPCPLCQDIVKTTDSAEEHMGIEYHTECLDAQYGNIDKGAI